MLPPPDLGRDDLSEADRDLKALAALIGGNFAGPEKMMDLSRGLSVHQQAKVKNLVNLSSGEGAVVFEEEHTDAEGKKLNVPNLFCIAIPVFEGGQPYRVVVRLRYRKAGAALVWFFDLYRHDAVFDHAVKESCDRVAQETGLRVLMGRPE